MTEKNITQECMIEGCNRMVEAKQLCSGHYRAQIVKPPCSVEGCDRPSKAQNLCNPHYLRFMRHGNTDTIRVRNICTIDNCNSYAMGRGLCRKHYTRWRQHGDPNIVLQTRSADGEFEQRFWQKAALTANTDHCWDWQRTITRTGYAMTTLTHKPDVFQSTNAKTVSAHRLAYALFYKSDPGGRMVLHSCDNRRCINPHHLRLGTHRDNMDDAVSRKRHARGERSTRSKLSEKDVVQMRQLSAEGMDYRDIARQFPIVEARHVKNVINRKAWRHL